MKRCITIVHDIMPPNVPFVFNVSNWTWIPDIQGQPGMTNHCGIIYTDWGVPNVKAAVIRTVLERKGTNPQVRFREISDGDHTGKQIGKDLTFDDQGGSIIINNIGALATDDFNAMNNLTTRQITVDVKGNGVLFLARYEIVYEFDDNAELLADLTNRINILEGKCLTT